jgi:Uncharacterized protein conserved in bacteria (DUF2330)
VRPVLFALLSALVWLARPSRAEACAAVTAPGSYVRLEAEKTLIVWDARAKVEHFVRRPVFEGDPRAFGFLVPSPVKPEVAKEDGALFDRLDALVPFGVAAAAAVHQGAPKAAPPVTIEQRVRIDDFEIVTLRAEDGAALTRWLATNGFADRPDIGAWAQKYVTRGWVFNAMRYAPAGAAVARAVDTPTIRLSFPIETPFYPYTEAPPAPADEQAYRTRTRSRAAPRALDLWVISDDELEARAAGKPAGPENVGHGAVSAQALATALGPTRTWGLDLDARPTWTVTRFHEETLRRTAFDDLAFVPKGGANDSDPPPTKRALWLLAAFIVLAGMAVALADGARTPME